MKKMLAARIHLTDLQVFRFLFLTVVSFTLFGCAGSNVCNSTSWTYALVTNIPLVGPSVNLSCIGSDVVHDVRWVSDRAEKSREEAAMVKTFRSSPAVESDISNTPGTLDFVMVVQDKYRVADYGIATEAEKTSLTGRYALDSKVLIIHDKEKYWLVAYDGEQIPVKK